MPSTHTGSADITTTVQTAMRDTFLRLFQAAVVEINVEPAVPDDADPPSGSVTGGWYRGTVRAGV